MGAQLLQRHFIVLRGIRTRESPGPALPRQAAGQYRSIRATALHLCVYADGDGQTGNSGALVAARTRCVPLRHVARAWPTWACLSPQQNLCHAHLLYNNSLGNGTVAHQAHDPAAPHELRTWRPEKLPDGTAKHVRLSSNPHVATGRFAICTVYTLTTPSRTKKYADATGTHQGQGAMGQHQCTGQQGRRNGSAD